jgi:hypothetical protein
MSSMLAAMAMADDFSTGLERSTGLRRRIMIFTHSLARSVTEECHAVGGASPPQGAKSASERDQTTIIVYRDARTGF